MLKRDSKRRWKARMQLGKPIPDTAFFEHTLVAHMPATYDAYDYSRCCHVVSNGLAKSDPRAPYHFDARF